MVSRCTLLAAVLSTSLMAVLTSPAAQSQPYPDSGYRQQQQTLRPEAARQPGFRRPPLAWNQLSPAQRAFLAPLRGTWNTLPPWRQHHMANQVDQWRQLPPDRQAQIQQRFERLARMSPEERNERMRIQSQFRDMPSAQRQRMFATWFRSLTPEQRRDLMQRFRQENQDRRAQGMNGQAPPPQR